jgi:hypothetical protein
MSQYEVVLNGFGPFGDMLTVLHYDVTSGDDPPDWDLVATAIRVHMVDKLIGNIVSTCGYTGITVREDVPGSVGQEYPFAAGTLNGSSASDDLAPQMAVLCRKLSGNLVNPTQGRIYQGGVGADGLTTGGIWVSSVTQDVEDFYELIRIINVAGPSSLRMVIKASKPSNPNTVAYNPVASVDGRPNPVTQRRRRIGSGS